MIKRSCILLFILIAGCTKSGAVSNTNPYIWASSDTIKIFKDSPQEDKNIIWSSKDNTVEIKGAKNETVAFQLVINGGKDGLSEVAVIPSVLKHSNGLDNIPLEKFHLFLEWYTLSKAKKDSPESKYYPDALIPFYDPYSRRSSEVCALFDIKAKENQPVWVDLEIPKNIPSGKYTGRLEVLSNGNRLESIKLILEVFPFTLPPERHITAYSDMYGAITKKERLTGNRDENWQIIKEYWIMARKHRFDINFEGYDLDPSASSRWSQDGTYWVNEFTWLNYDKYYGQIITGEIFPDKLPPNTWRLPFAEAKYINLFGINCKYLQRSSWDKPGGCYKKDYRYWENKIKSLAQVIQEHFLKKEFIGEWPKGTLAKSFLYTIDEPKQYVYHYPYIKDFSTLVNEAAPQIKFMLTEQPEEPLFGYVDIWAAPASALAPQRIKQRRESGEKVWFYQWAEPYIGSHVLNGDAIALRMWGWAAWKYNVDGVFLWASNYWSSDNPYTDPQVYEHGKATNRYGDGYIFYPGRMLDTIGFNSIDGPVSSIRMKMWRRGFQDYEYFWLAKESGKERQAASVANSLVKSALADNYKEVTDSVSCRNKKGDGQKTKFIQGRCIGACSDFTSKSCWYNEGILIGPWDCDDGPDESGKYPQWWEDPRVKKFDGWSKNPDEWVAARYKLAHFITPETEVKNQIRVSEASENNEEKVIYQRTRKESKDIYPKEPKLANGKIQVIEDFSKPIVAAAGEAFGDQGQFTFELYRGGKFIIDGESSFAWQKSDSYRDVAIIRSTNPLPKTYRISAIVGDIDYDLSKINGLENDSEYEEGPRNENGCYLLAITDEVPSGHHTNDWWHQHRKVCIDVDNTIWNTGRPHPFFMVYFDRENKLVSHNEVDQWVYRWERAATYSPRGWYRVVIEKNNRSFIMYIYDSKGRMLNGGIVPLKRVWHEDENHKDYLVIGDPHENYYQGSMKISSISITSLDK